jgi:hypothetical protein
MAWGILCGGKLSHLAVAAALAVGTLAGTAAFAQIPTCNGKNVYPCSVGGTLLLLSKPTDYAFNFGSGVSAGAGPVASVVNEDTTGVSLLESHLWEVANILRGPVDAADFKTYVFPLLFFKRISDVHDEEYAAALAESDGDQEYALFSQNYRFQIPEGCHWKPTSEG